MTHLERLYRNLLQAQNETDDVKIEEIKKEIKLREPQFTAVSPDYLKMKPTYFNSGCCCFSDGDITGIEIANGSIRLIKWTSIDHAPQRFVLEERSLKELVMG
jgi:hypothetical protein